MADKYIKGVAEALGRAGAAMTDATQGTSFYKDIQERDKEERLTQLALEREERQTQLALEKEKRDRDFMREQMAAEKAKLDNQNAVQSTSAMVDTFSDRVNGLLGNAMGVTDQQANQLLSDSEAYINRIATQENLDPTNREIFAGQMTATLSSVEVVKQNALANEAAKLPSAEERFTAAQQLPNLPSLQLFLSRPSVVSDLAKGEETWQEIISSAPEQIDEEMLALREAGKEFESRTFRDLALANPGLAAQILKRNPIELQQAKLKNQFMNVDVPRNRETIIGIFNQLPKSLGAVLDVGFEDRLNALLHEDNIVLGSKGYEIRGLTDFIQKEMRPAIEQVNKLNLTELSKLASQEAYLNDVFGAEFANQVKIAKANILTQSTTEEVIQAGREISAKNFDDLEDLFVVDFDEAAEMNEDPGLDTLAGIGIGTTMGLGAGVLASFMFPATLPFTLPYLVAAGGGVAGGIAASDVHQNFRGAKATALSQATKSLYSSQAERDMLASQLQELKARTQQALALGLDQDARAIGFQQAAIENKLAVFDAQLPNILVDFLHNASSLEFYDDEKAIEQLLLNEFGDRGLDATAINPSALSNLTGNNSFEKLTSFFQANTAAIAKTTALNEAQTSAVIASSMQELQTLYNRLKEVGEANPDHFEDMPELIGYSLEDHQDPTLLLLTNLLTADV